MNNLKRDMQLPAEVKEIKKPEKNPKDVVIFLRKSNFFSKDKDRRQEEDVDGFIDYLEGDLLDLLKLRQNPVLAPGLMVEDTKQKVDLTLSAVRTKQTRSFVDDAIETLEEAGYLEPGKISHQPTSKEEAEAIKNAIKEATLRAVSECEPLTEEEMRQSPPF